MAQFDTPPEINYLAKDYAGFRRLLLDHLSLWLPDWTEEHPADMGHALLEVLAYAADYLSYYQDAVASEAYLGTARLRRSVKRHVRLLDYGLHDGCNARVWVQVRVEEGSGPVLLPRGTPLLTRLERGGAGPVLQRDSPAYSDALAQAPVVFETMVDSNLYGAHNEIDFCAQDTQTRPQEVYSWLKRGATRAMLNYPEEKERPDLQVGQVLMLEEIRDPGSGRYKGADPAHRHPVRLTRVTRIAARQVEIEWGTDDALPFDLCLSASRDRLHRVTISVARGNIVLADHGRTIEDEELPGIPAAGRYYPHLRHRGLTFSEPFHRGRAAIWSAAEMLGQDARRALPCIELRELGQVLQLQDGRSLLPLEKHQGSTYPVKRWAVRSELLSSGTYERDYAVEIEDDGRAYLRFGFLGVGWRPEVVGAPFVATYRIGNGSAGNVGRETIAHIVTADKRITGVRNPLPAQGGTDPASTEEARLHAPQAFRERACCVTGDDYAQAAERHPQVIHALAHIRRTGSWRTAFIYVQRRGNRPLDDDFQQTLCSYLEPFRLAGYDLEIRGAHLVPLQIALDVHVQPHHQASAVRAALHEAFSDRALPDNEPGFFHADRWTFGQALYQSQVIARAMAVPGVARVDVCRFRRRSAEHDNDPIPVAPLEIIQVHNDPDAPFQGTIQFELR